MKSLLLLCLVAFSGALAADKTCFQNAQEDCGSSSSGISLLSCNAKYGAFNGDPHSTSLEMQAYANLHLKRSYEYLLSASFFNNYERNRVGFSKLFRKLSDDAWEKTIDLVKHVTMRGHEMNFAQVGSRHQIDVKKEYVAELQELEALAKALDTQKELAERAFHIHHESTRVSKDLHDPEIAQYLEEEFIEDHSKLVRQLAGHTSDLKKFIAHGKDLPLSLYLFDEYLQKTV